MEAGAGVGHVGFCKPHGPAHDRSATSTEGSGLDLSRSYPSILAAGGCGTSATELRPVGRRERSLGSSSSGGRIRTGDLLRPKYWLEDSKDWTRKRSKKVALAVQRCCCCCSAQLTHSCCGRSRNVDEGNRKICSRIRACKRYKAARGGISQRSPSECIVSSASCALSPLSGLFGRFRADLHLDTSTPRGMGQLM